jgi:transposase-like protein
LPDKGDCDKEAKPVGFAFFIFCLENPRGLCHRSVWVDCEPNCTTAIKPALPGELPMPRDTAVHPSPQFVAAISRLSQQEQLGLCCLLSELVNGEHSVALIEQARPPAACPHCRHSGFHRYGKSNDLQRYRCLACKRTFNALTGTPLARLRHKTLWLSYCGCLLDPACTVDSAASRPGIHRNTSFRWRHRFLDWLKTDRPLCLQGIAELGTTFLRESQKGSRNLPRPPRHRGGARKTLGQYRKRVAVVVARDRAGQTIDSSARPGKWSAAALHHHLRSKVSRDILLLSDSNGIYRAFAVRAGISHCVLNSRRRTRLPNHMHLQEVDGYQKRFQHWLAHFRGVATRYLDNYLGWHWAIDHGRLDSAAQMLRAALASPNSQR